MCCEVEGSREHVCVGGTAKRTLGEMTGIVQGGPPLSDLSPEQFPPPSRSPRSPGPSRRVFLIVSLCSDWYMIWVNYVPSPRVYFQPLLLNHVLLPVYFWASVPFACSRPWASSLASRIRWFRPLSPPPRAAVLANHCTHDQAGCTCHPCCLQASHVPLNVY